MLPGSFHRIHFAGSGGCLYVFFNCKESIRLVWAHYSPFLPISLIHIFHKNYGFLP
ncbi:hypothetical protein CLOSTASPAR_01375 [[Clostridium] asparagiforme DSM 15981]|uniref:Uncharacterized protein n=1 Tax=[Clostridium] asparagiforme DSM 15981 TaxID=518636 RepID=C0CWK9_9FIRM|nr:hypothetical protein CLOSTASPAR_01375 [[Clostridium] asparagiforme DSM 15981]